MTDPVQFEPPAYLRNPHLQTILNGQGPRRWRAQGLQRRLESRSLLLSATDGTRLLAELDQSDVGKGKVLVVLLHGWEGSSRSCYMVTTTARLLAEGCDVLRVNLRDHGDSHHLNRELFNSTRSAEVGSALQLYLQEQGHERVILAGFSLGASFALRIAADYGQQIGLNACVAICPPADPARSMHALNNGFAAYERYFFKRWRNSLRRKLACFPELAYADDLARARSLDDLNRVFIPSHTVYARVDDYFRAYSLVGNRLSALASPAHLIATEDDPIIPVEDMMRIDPQPHLKLEIHRYGGHCGFIQDFAGHSWAEDRILQLVQRYSS